MLNSLVLLILVSYINGQPTVAMKPMPNMKVCEQVKALTIRDLVSNHHNYAAVSCSEHKLGLLL